MKSSMRLFYKKLYSEAKNLNDSNLSCVFNGVPVLSDKLRESLEGPLSYHELLNALKVAKMTNLQVRMVSASNL